MLAWQFQKNMIKEQLLREAELDRIADRVISRLSITVDASQIVQEIEIFTMQSNVLESEGDRNAADISKSENGVRSS